MMEVLLRFGAEPNSKTLGGVTPLMLACSEGHLDVVRTFVQLTGGRTVNERTHYNQTAFWRACHYGHVEVAKFLLVAGADHTVPHRKGRTARQTAERRGHLHCSTLIQVRRS
jgi:ankyrin repeat protein